MHPHAGQRRSDDLHCALGLREEVAGEVDLFVRFFLSDL